MKAVIFDIDGTLCEISPERQELVEKRDWELFHEIASSEFSLPAIVSAAREQRKKGWVIILLTARPNKYRHITKAWLRKNHIIYDELFMREERDFRHSYEVKEQHLKNLLKTYEIKFAYDDRKCDLDMFCKYSIPTMIVKEGLAYEYVT